MTNETCPICGATAHSLVPTDRDTTIVDCPRCGRFEITYEFLKFSENNNEHPGTYMFQKAERWLWETKGMGLRRLQVEERPGDEFGSNLVLTFRKLGELYEEGTDLETIHDESLRNIYRLTKSVGQTVGFEDNRWIFPTMDKSEADRIANDLAVDDLIERITGNKGTVFRITRKGIKYLSDLQNQPMQQQAREGTPFSEMFGPEVPIPEGAEADIELVIEEVFNWFVEKGDWPQENVLWFDLKDRLITDWRTLSRLFSAKGIRGRGDKDAKDPIRLELRAIEAIGSEQAQAEVERFLAAVRYLARRRAAVTPAIEDEMKIDLDEVAAGLGMSHPEMKRTAHFLRTEVGFADTSNEKGRITFMLRGGAAEFASVKSLDEFEALLRGGPTLKGNPRPDITAQMPRPSPEMKGEPPPQGSEEEGPPAAEEELPAEKHDPVRTPLPSHPPVVAPGGLATYASDAPSYGRGFREEDDKLDFKVYAGALGQVIAAKDTPAPLAVGLFGHWGVGKTTFMKLLRTKIEKYEKAGQKAEEEDKPTAYFSHVACIEFNAWHYVEANLFASLVSHIFDELAVFVDKDKEESREQKRQKLAKKLEENDAEHQKLKEALAAKAEARAIAEVALERAREELHSKKQTFSEISLSDAFSLALKDDETKKTVEEARKNIEEKVKELNLDAATKTANEALATVRDLQKAGSRARVVWQRFKASPVSPLAIVGLFIMAAVPFGIWVINHYLDWSWPELWTTLSTYLAAFTAKLGWANKGVKGALEVFDVAFNKIDGAITAAKEKREEVLKPIAGELEKAKQAEIAAKEALNEAFEEERRLQQAIDELAVGRYLLKFIKERAGCDDYHRHLGLAHVVHKDFKQLSELLAEARREKQKGNEPDPRLPQVDRIVLFIDDLDRCPHDCVIKVLEAVHLMLAFDLFVVVVAVDPRWLELSLEKHYPELLARKTWGRDERGEYAFGRLPATPQNYLEKIFQVPLSIRQMNKDGYINLIRGEVKISEPGQQEEAGKGDDQTASKNLEEALQGAAGTGQPVAPKGEPSEKAKGDKGDVTVPGQNPAEKGPGQGALGEQADPGADKGTDGGQKLGDQGGAEVNKPGQDPKKPDDEQVEEEEVPDANPKQLALLKEERDAMELLHEFIRTPRSAKRFINLYRLLRVTVPDEELIEPFLSGDPPEYRIAMLLLAAQVGFPEESSMMFEEMSKWQSFVIDWRCFHRCMANPEASGFEGDYEKMEWTKSQQRLSSSEVWKTDRWQLVCRLFEKADEWFFGNDDVQLVKFQIWASRVSAFAFLGERRSGSEDAMRLEQMFDLEESPPEGESAS